MSSLFDVGKSALSSYRQSLAVTGQNIANINTEGYKRREANLEEVTGSQGSVTSLPDQTGLGVRVTDINRSFDQYLLDRARSATSSFQKLDVFVDQLKELENMLLPDKGNLGAQIASFFDSLREVAASPSDIAPRAVAVEQGKSLAAGFNNYATQLNQLLANTESVMEDSIDTINLFSNQLADINGRIMAAGQSGQSPNSIYDLRDKAVSDLAKLTDLTVSYSGRGVVSIKLGSSGVGPTIVDGKNAMEVGLRNTSSGLQPTVRSGGEDVATNQIAAGMAGGLIDAHKAVSEALTDIDHLAALMSQEMNSQHRQGITLDGEPGGNMFANKTLTLSTGVSNRSEVTGEILVTDPEKLPLSSLTATYSKDDDIWTLSGAGLERPLRGSRQIAGPGFVLTVNGEAAAGDTLHLSAVTGAASAMRFLIDKPQQLAAASDLLVISDADNLSEAEIDVEVVTPQAKASLPRLDQVMKSSSSPIEASEFMRDGLVAEIPAGSGPVSLTSLTRQATAKFQVSGLELPNLTQLSFKLENTAPAGPFTFNVNYNTAFPSASSESRWTDTKELADMLNKGVLTDASNNSLVDYGLYASGANGTLTLTSSKGDFDNTDAFVPKLSFGSGSIRATVKDSIVASDLQIFTREGRHVAGTVLTNTQLAELMTAENGFAEQAVYTGDYLNQTEPGYRGMSLDIDRASGMHSLTIGANGTGASAVGKFGGMPVSSASDQTISVTLSNGVSASVDLKSGDAASDVAALLNDKLQHLGIKARANMRVELSNLTTTGTVAFKIEGDNDTPIAISASVVPSDLTNLVTALNDQSSRTGITASLSSNKKRIIMEKADGKDIFLSDYAASAPQITSKIVDFKGSEAAPEMVLGGDGNTKDHARFSGLIELDSANSFSLTTEAGVVSNSAADTTRNGLVSISSNQAADKKTIQYSVNGTADMSDSSYDGQRAVAAAGRYGLTLPTSDSSVSFSAEVTSTSASQLTQESIQKNLIEALRQQAPLASLSGGDAAAKPQSVIYTFSGPTVIDPTPGTGDSLSLTVAGTNLTVDMSDGDGMGTAVTTAQLMTEAAARLVNNAALGVTATAYSDPVDIARVDYFAPGTGAGTLGDAIAAAVSGDKFKFDNGTIDIEMTIPSGVNAGDFTLADLVQELESRAPLNSYKFEVEAGELKITDETPGANTETYTLSHRVGGSYGPALTFGVATGANVTGVTAAPVYKLKIEANADGQSFSMGAVNFVDASAQSTLALSESVTAKSMPVEGQGVYVDFADETYHITMQDGELHVSGGEDGRLTVYFDDQKKLQIIGGGTLSGDMVKVTSDSKISGNSDNAALFGLSTTKMRFASTPLMASSSMNDLELIINEENYTISMGPSGGVTPSPSLPAGVSVISTVTSSTEGRVVIEYDPAVHNLTFDKPQNALGMKTADLRLILDDNGISIESLTGDVVDVNATASSLASETITINDVAPEDFLVFTTGSGARAVSAVYDQIATETDSFIASVLDRGGLTVKSVSDDAMRYEILDSQTGHSIATRVVDDENGFVFDGYHMKLKGKTALNDQFTLERTENGAGDARNLNAMIAQQSKDMNGAASGGFSSIFSTIVATVGASVRSNEQALDGAEATKEAAIESEAEFSGVNLDSEAAALIEFQQAYQASARVLSTARELFQTLIDVV